MPKPVCRVRARERINRIPPSAERNERLHSSGFGQRSQEGSVEDHSDLPSLPDLLEELESEAVDLNSLEQLTQTLLEDIARDLESAAQKAADQESVSVGEDIPQKVVGSPSKQLESSGTEMLKEETSIEQDISEYLLLHHNYAKVRPKTSTTCRKSPTSTRKLKHIRPKVNVATKSKLSPKSTLPAQSLTKSSNKDEILFGTFNENSNIITVFVNEDSIPLNEVIVEESLHPENNTDIPVVTKTNNSLHIPLTCEAGLSPKSDLGYESIDSPLSNSDLENWDQCVSELFPSLF